MLMFFIGGLCALLFIAFWEWASSIDKRITALEKKMTEIQEYYGRAEYEVRLNKAA